MLYPGCASAEGCWLRDFDWLGSHLQLQGCCFVLDFHAFSNQVSGEVGD